MRFDRAGEAIAVPRCEDSLPILSAPFVGQFFLRGFAEGHCEFVGQASAPHRGPTFVVQMMVSPYFSHATFSANKMLIAGLVSSSTRSGDRRP